MSLHNDEVKEIYNKREYKNKISQKKYNFEKVTSHSSKERTTIEMCVGRVGLS